MDLDEYQKRMAEFDLTDGKKSEISIGLIEKVMGLAGEAGETVDKFKKIYRDHDGEISEENKAEIIKELGDVTWYVAAIARYLDTPFSEVLKKNVEKLVSRKDRGELHGSGDNR